MGESKKCFKCWIVKDLGDFYRHAQMSDGFLNKCKECTKADTRKARAARIEHYREYDRNRGNRQSRDYQRRYREANKAKYAAHIAVNNALRAKKIVKAGSCEVCGSDSALHAHHDDYSNPLDVRWLCGACHHQWHAKYGEAANAHNMSPF